MNLFRKNLIKVRRELETLRGKQTYRILLQSPELIAEAYDVLFTITDSLGNSKRTVVRVENKNLH